MNTKIVVHMRPNTHRVKILEYHTYKKLKRHKCLYLTLNLEIDMNHLIIRLLIFISGAAASRHYDHTLLILLLLPPEIILQSKIPKGWRSPPFNTVSVRFSLLWAFHARKGSIYEIDGAKMFKDDVAFSYREWGTLRVGKIINYI